MSEREAINLIKKYLDEYNLLEEYSGFKREAKKDVGSARYHH